jgi:plasmid stabilization system protein ParE
VARVVYSQRAFQDLDRLTAFLVKETPLSAVAAIDTLTDGIRILERHPLVGRRCEQGLRELVIAYGQRGQVALYSYEPRVDVALILAIRHQGEAGFQD